MGTWWQETGRLGLWGAHRAFQGNLSVSEWGAALQVPIPTAEYRHQLIYCHKTTF